MVNMPWVVNESLKEFYDNSLTITQALSLLHIEKKRMIFCIKRNKIHPIRCDRGYRIYKADVKRIDNQIKKGY
jgi:hypothetical protein